MQQDRNVSPDPLFENSEGGFSLPQSAHFRPAVPANGEGAGDLLSEDDRGLAGSDKLKSDRPEVPDILFPFPFTRRAERLAREAGGPDGSIVAPSGPTQGIAPDADPREEVDLSLSCQVGRSKIDN